MRQVTKAEFYDHIYKHGLDVHPRPERQHTVWEMRRNRRVFGVSRPGYALEGPESYEMDETVTQ